MWYPKGCKNSSADLKTLHPMQSRAWKITAKSIVSHSETLPKILKHEVVQSRVLPRLKKINKICDKGLEAELKTSNS